MAWGAPWLGRKRAGDTTEQSFYECFWRRLACRFALLQKQECQQAEACRQGKSGHARGPPATDQRRRHCRACAHNLCRRGPAVQIFLPSCHNCACQVMGTRIDCAVAR